jgi:hypothetical protein
MRALAPNAGSCARGFKGRTRQRLGCQCEGYISRYQLCSRCQLSSMVPAFVVEPASLLYSSIVAAAGSGATADAEFEWCGAFICASRLHDVSYDCIAFKCQSLTMFVVSFGKSTWSEDQSHPDITCPFRHLLAFRTKSSQGEGLGVDVSIVDEKVEKYKQDGT